MILKYFVFSSIYVDPPFRFSILSLCYPITTKRTDEIFAIPRFVAVVYVISLWLDDRTMSKKTKYFVISKRRNEMPKWQKSTTINSWSRRHFRMKNTHQRRKNCLLRRSVVKKKADAYTSNLTSWISVQERLTVNGHLTLLGFSHFKVKRILYTHAWFRSLWPSSQNVWVPSKLKIQNKVSIILFLHVAQLSRRLEWAIVIARRPSVVVRPA